MYLKAIEMQGFKSFPDKTVLNFGKGITAVVGPNGSGKSNLSDAMRWVLGEQSTKNLRGSKMEDVIFSGTDSRRAVGFAEVTLKLDNSDMALNNPKKEVTVTRRYYRSGESEYKLNGEQARLRDIHELFMDTGLGRDGYSMVSQGKIETLISGKSEDRRDMLEEAAGISHYRYRRADAMRRLNQAEENLLRLRDILTELESRVGPLKIQSEKAQKFLEYAGEKKELEIGIWLYTIEKTKNDLREQEKKITIADAQYTDVCKSLEEITEKIDSAIAETQRITVNVDEIRRACSQLEEQAALLESQVAVQENTILHNNETIERIEREKTEETDTDTEIATQIEDAKKVIDDYSREADDIIYTIDSIKIIFSRLEAIYSCFPIKERQDFVIKTLDLLRYGRRDDDGGLKDIYGWYALYRSQADYVKTKLKLLNELYKEGKYSEVMSFAKEYNEQLEEFYVKYGIKEITAEENE